MVKPKKKEESDRLYSADGKINSDGESLPAVASSAKKKSNPLGAKKKSASDVKNSSDEAPVESSGSSPINEIMKKKVATPLFKSYTLGRRPNFSQEDIQKYSNSAWDGRYGGISPLYPYPYSAVITIFIFYNRFL